MTFHLLLVGKQLLHLIRIRDISTLLHRRTSPHAVFPSLQSREVLDVDAGPACCADPTPVGDVSDGTLVAYQIVGLAVAKVLVQDAVETSGLVLVAVDAVFDLFWCVLRRVVSDGEAYWRVCHLLW